MNEAKNTPEPEQDLPTPEVEQELSQVASNPKRNMIILFVIAIAFVYLFFNLFMSSSEDEEAEKPTPIPEVITRPVQITVEDSIPTIPTLPSPPKLEDPTPPPPPPVEQSAVQALPNIEKPLNNDEAEVNLTNNPNMPALPELPNEAELLPVPDAAQVTPSLPMGQVQSQDAKKRQEAKRKSAIILIAGTPPTKTPAEIQQANDFRHRGNMNYVLGKGKILDAIVETALSTDFGGEIRAVINRDIYSEWGKNILIPKGSRVFGEYSVGITGGYGRIDVNWTRIDLINGYSINLSGNGIDPLGRKGYSGRVDSKFRERLTNAVLRSAFNIALAKGLDKVVKPQTDSQTANSNTETATNVKNIANGIFTQNGVNDTQKRLQICANTLSAITNKSSATYTQIQTSCNNLATDATSTESAKLVALMSVINSISDNLIKNVVSETTKSKAQEASEEAYEDISDTVKTIVAEQELKPTVTIDQGTKVKIYVNRDYNFPPTVVHHHKGL